MNISLLHFIGEIFGGVHVSSDSNDAEIIMQYLGKCCPCTSHEHIKECSSSGEGLNSVPELLSTIKGPWALIYWQVTLSGKFQYAMILKNAICVFHLVMEVFLVLSCAGKFKDHLVWERCIWKAEPACSLAKFERL